MKNYMLARPRAKGGVGGSPGGAGNGVRAGPVPDRITPSTIQPGVHLRLLQSMLLYRALPRPCQAQSAEVLAWLRLRNQPTPAVITLSLHATV